jgi:hypothetical protein
MKFMNEFMAGLMGCILFGGILKNDCGEAQLYEVLQRRRDE